MPSLFDLLTKRELTMQEQGYLRDRLAILEAQRTIRGQGSLDMRGNLTVSSSGSAVVGEGAANRLMVWSDEHTAGISYGLTTLGDLIYMASTGAAEQQQYFDNTLVSWADGASEIIRATITLDQAPIIGETVDIAIDIYSGYNQAGFAVTWRLRRDGITGAVIASHDVVGNIGAHDDHWTLTTNDATPSRTYVLTTSQVIGATILSDYRLVTLSKLSTDPIPARLPIGSEGQFLRVASGLPVWESVSVLTSVSDTASVDLTQTGSVLSADVIPGGVDHNSLANLTVGDPHTQYITKGLLTTRGDIIRRGASAPERYGLSVPAAGVLNYLGVANGETDPSWKSASSNPGAAASILQSSASGYLQLERLGLGITPSYPLHVSGKSVLTHNVATVSGIDSTLLVDTRPYSGGASAQWGAIFATVNTVAGQSINQAGGVYTALYHNGGYSLADWRGLETGAAYVWAGSNIQMASGLVCGLPDCTTYGGTVDQAQMIYLPSHATGGIGLAYTIYSTSPLPNRWAGDMQIVDAVNPIDARRDGGSLLAKLSSYASAATSGPKLYFQSARGEYAAPLNISAGDWLGSQEWWQYINGDMRQSGYIKGVAGTTISSTSYPMSLDIRLVKEGATSLSQAMLIGNGLTTIYGNATISSSTNGTGPALKLSSTDASVNNGDIYASLDFEQHDSSSTTKNVAARIFAQAPSTIGSDITPGDLVFATAQGANDPTEYVRIKSTGATNFMGTQFTPHVFGVDKTNADFFDGTSLGTELVVAGDFSTAVGWTTVNCTLDVSSGKGVMTATGANYGVRQSFTTVVGKLYKVTLNWFGSLGTGLTNASHRFNIGTSASGTQIASYIFPFANNLLDASYTAYFIATTTTTWIATLTTTASTVSVWDDISVKEVTGGNVISRGKFTGGGTAGVTVDVSGNVILEGDTYWTGTGAGLPYGSCWGNEIGWSQASAAQNTWYVISDADMSDGKLNLFTHDGSGKLTASRAGTYLVNYTMTMTVNANNKHCQTGIAINGTAQSDGIVHCESVGSSFETVMAGTAILTLTAGQYIEICIRTTDTGTPTLEVDHLNITAVMVGS